MFLTLFGPILPKTSVEGLFASFAKTEERRGEHGSVLPAQRSPESYLHPATGEASSRVPRLESQQQKEKKSRSMCCRSNCSQSTGYSSFLPLSAPLQFSPDSSNASVRGDASDFLIGSDSWGQVTLATVKEVRGHYKLSTRWPASELSVVDGTDAAKETAEFHLHLEKVYRWETDSPVEKRALITCLWNINHRYLQDRVLPWQHGRVSEEREEDGKVEEEEEAFQELTAREAADVQRLMEESDLAVSNAKAFTKALHASLADMDQENLQALLMSEFQVEQLLKLLDEALEEVGHIEEVLSQHDRLLRSVQRQIETLHKYGAWLQSVDHNHKQLQSELCHLVDGLSLSEEHVHVLTKGDLQDVDQVRACVTAGQGRSLQWEEDLILKPGRFHKQLLQYAPLMCWLRESSPRVFQQLTKVYAENIGRLFDRQMKDFFDAARLQLSIAKETKKTGTLPASTTARGTGSDFVPLSSESIASQVVHQVLSQLELVCVLEQQFLTVFFSLDRGRVSVEFPATRRGSAVDQVQSCAELRQKRRPHSWFSAGSGLPEPVVGEWDCVRSVLGCVEPRLGALLSLCERAEPLNCLASLKAAGAGLSRHQNSPNASFWCSVLHSTVQHSQRCLRNYTVSERPISTVCYRPI
ncbi:hypothetical protein JZ751_018790 [Albula glossodonta]|uniref:Exocyst complex component Sec3 PIP2-binding N-terminal domain-containing protein n=1 Tax=Albula glossodonta TaxID=121402 RepID=A0A8T2NQ35_9TELE|nr:hypothetical protein JZ751_018790 [Albula glossodonta]